VKKLVGEKITLLEKEEVEGAINKQTNYEDLLRVTLRVLLPFYKAAEKDVVEYFEEAHEERKE
jgi:hypothetical protein